MSKLALYLRYGAPRHLSTCPSKAKQANQSKQNKASKAKQAKQSMQSKSSKAKQAKQRKASKAKQAKQSKLALRCVALCCGAVEREGERGRGEREHFTLKFPCPHPTMHLCDPTPLKHVPCSICGSPSVVARQTRDCSLVRLCCFECGRALCGKAATYDRDHKKVDLLMDQKKSCCVWASFHGADLDLRSPGTAVCKVCWDRYKARIFYRG